MAKRPKLRVFDEMKESLRDALDFERGGSLDLRVTTIPAPPRKIGPSEIRRIRRALHASQPVFAAYLNVSANAVRSWEQGTRRPRHATLKLLAIARRNPRALLIT